MDNTHKHHEGRCTVKIDAQACRGSLAGHVDSLAFRALQNEVADLWPLVTRARRIPRSYNVADLIVRGQLNRQFSVLVLFGGVCTCLQQSQGSVAVPFSDRCHTFSSIKNACQWESTYRDARLSSRRCRWHPAGCGSQAEAAPWGPTRRPRPDAGPTDQACP